MDHRHPIARSARRIAAGTLLALAAAAAAAPKPPVAPVRPVTDDYHGTKVVDDYRYMENLGDPEVRAWMKAQAEFTRSRLDALPGRDALQARIHALLNADLARGGFVRRGDRYFYQVRRPGAQQPTLNYRDGLKGEEHLLVDPARFAKDGASHTALDWYVPSWDGRRVAYGISAGGSEASVLHVLDIDTGRDLPEAIPRTSEGAVAWRPDNRSFFYMQFPKPTAATLPSETQFNARTLLHTLGERADGEGDPAVFGRGVSATLDVPEGQGTWIVVSPDSSYALAVANHNLDDNPSTLYVAPLAQVTDAATPWRKVADVADGVRQFELRGDRLYFLSQRGAPRFRLLSTPLAHPDVAHPTEVVAQGSGVITDFAFARDALYVREREGAVSRVRRFAGDGGAGRVVPMPFVGNVGRPVTDPREPGALIDIRGWLQAARVVSYDPVGDTSTDTGLRPRSSVDTSSMEAEEAFAVSYDGTRIPLSILHRKGLKLDGSHPTILTGYGSYGVSLEPRFNPADLAWLERGGVLAIAHLRGGGEYGEDWHKAGRMPTKINTILDFIACGQYLVDARYTVPARLAGKGGSAGGIPVGGALTWRPDLFGVILDQVGLSDTLRTETEPNGPPNVSEFGSVRTEAGFHGLYAMSAYAHVRNGTHYPATLFVTGANDPRVAPWQMAKMAARVQAATASDRPVLLRIDYDAGHGMGSTASQRESMLADLWSFALWQMGDPAFQPRPGP